ncbi:MAG: 2-C-methyl-D-erythritol 4-phosphate cytidylyltransferase [Bacillota bacterium]|nr:2-C-methyl-D-erythritol 4-phosphate cytidylyltransferase [Bacillota bacterium]
MGKNCAIILAAGKGKRMGADKNKLFLHIVDKPVLYYTIKTFSENNNIDEIVIVTSIDDMEYCQKEIIDKFSFKKVRKVIVGGLERQDSVLQGLLALTECEIVLIHDGARPFVSQKIINEGIENAKQFKACACGVIPKDTIKIIDENKFSAGTPDRSGLFCVQTPQCFDYELILECHKRIKKDNIIVTDDTMAVERYGHKVYLFEGSYNNIKITTPEDLIVGENILMAMRNQLSTNDNNF